MKRCPVGTEIQTLIFDRAHFTEAKACGWAASHDFECRKTDVKKNTIHIRQKDPVHFQHGSFRTITLTSGVTAVIGCPK